MSAVHSAFGQNPALLSRILKATASPEYVILFNDISHYVLDLLHQQQESQPTNTSEPTTKKRKLDTTNGSTTSVNGDATFWTASPATGTFSDVSFTLPMRKKLKLTLVGTTNKNSGIVGLNPAGEKELAISWLDVDHVISVPIPEKAQLAHYFVVIPVRNAGLSQTDEPVVFTIPGGAANGATFENASGDIRAGESYEELIRRIFDERLSSFGKKVVVPDEREFVSAIVQAHRKTEKGWHVKAYRGSKDGFLYFLPNGILFGFKKPLLFFPFSSISSISYSSILQRTFNLNITATSSSTPNDSKDSKDTKEEDFEFSMLDQADFPGIDAYIKRHGLNDASLAATRRAKLYNVNKETAVKKEDEDDSNAEAETDGHPGGEDMEQALQDAEDEQEEDYDPSGGSSEGSGEDSDEEDGGENAPGDDDLEAGEGEEEEDFEDGKGDDEAEEEEE